MDVKGLVELARKNIATVSAIVVLIVCGVLYFLNSGKKIALEEEYRVLAIQNSNILKNIKFYEGLEKDIEKMEAHAEDAESRLFDSNELAANYNYFFKIEAETGVSIDGLNQLEVSSGELERLGLKELKDFSHIRYVMTVTGSYDSILRFFRGLEGGKAFFRLDTLETYPTQDNVSVKLSGFVLGKKEAKV